MGTEAEAKQLAKVTQTGDTAGIKASSPKS